MATEVREVERKYDAGPGARLPDLSDLPDVASQSEPGEQILEATYYDTERLDLARAGITLRRRLGGHDAGWHLKLPGAVGARTELRLPHALEPPREFLDLLTARLRGREVRPVARITTTRRRRSLRGRDGTLLAEAVLDDVTAEALGEQATLSRWNEVEFELAGGGPALMKAADRRLRRSGLHPSGHSSKLHAALAGRLPKQDAQTAAADRAPTAGSGAGDVVRAYIREQIQQLLATDVMVRRDRPDAVHKMRVAGRRLRSALRTFSPLLPQRDGELAHLEDELHWLAGVLGEARDQEVLQKHLIADVTDLPTELVLGPVPARIAGHFAPQSAAARRDLTEALGSPRYLALLDRLDLLLTRPLPPAAARPAARTIPALVRHEFKRARRRIDRAAKAGIRPATAVSGTGTGAGTAIGAGTVDTSSTVAGAVTGTGTERDVALHQARKAVKRARYAAEAAVPAFPEKTHAAASTAKALEKVQSVLGDHQDTVIARTATHHLAVRAHAARENAFTYGLLYQRQADQAAALRKKARKAWKKANTKKRTAWMG